MQVALTLSTDYITKPARFIVTHDEVTDYDIVIGYNVLEKEQLLPDLHGKELVCRIGNCVKLVARDIRISSPETFNCLLKRDVKIPPRSCSVVEIEVENLELGQESTIVVHPNGTLPVHIDPAVVHQKDKQALLLVVNEDDIFRKLKKGQIIGEAEELKVDDPSIHMVELSELTKMIISVGHQEG